MDGSPSPLHAQQSKIPSPKRSKPKAVTGRGSSSGGTRRATATSSANKPKLISSKKHSSKATPSAPREQQAGQPSGEGTFIIMPSVRGSNNNNSSSSSSSNGGSRRDLSSRAKESASDESDGSSSSSLYAEENRHRETSRSESENSSREDSQARDDGSDSDSSSGCDSSLLVSGFGTSRKEAPMQLTTQGRVEAVMRIDRNTDAHRAATTSAAPPGAGAIINESSSSLLPKPWLTTEEYLPSSCSSSDAEADDDDDNDSDSDSDNDATSSSSDSSSDSSFDEDGIEYIEYFAGDDEERRSMVFLHMPPPPPPQQQQKQQKRQPPPQHQQKRPPPPQQQQQQRSQGQGASNASPAVPKPGAPPVPALHRPAAGSWAVPPGLAQREPLGAGRATNSNPKEIKIQPSDLLSQISHPTTTSSFPQEMPPLVDLVEADESDEDNSDDDSDSSDDSSDDASSDDSDDDSSIDESEYRDILQPQAAKVVHMPPERAQSAASPKATKTGPPLLPPKPPSVSAPVAPLPRPAVRAPASGAAPAKAPRIPMELQAVFLASQQGEVVDKPPSSGAAFRVFGSWFGRSSRNHHNNNNSAKEKGNSTSRLLPSMLQRRQQSTRHQEDRAQQKKEPGAPSASSQGKGGTSRRIAQFFRSKQLRKQHSASSFRRMPQLPEISEVSCSVDTSIVDPTIHGAGGDGELTSITEEAGGTHPPSSPLRRAFSVRSFGSSRRSSAGSAVSSSSAASSAASANSSSAASPRMGTAGAARSKGSRSRKGQRDTVGKHTNGSLCSQSCQSRLTEGSRGSSHPIASIGSASIDDDDDSTHSWDSGVSDLSSDDEALYADLEQMLSQAKAEFTSKTARATPDIRESLGPKSQATASFAPTVPSFTQNKQSSARPASARANVYVPASPSPARSSAAAPRPVLDEPIIPDFHAASRQANGQSAFEPTIPSFSEKRIKKAPSATSFASSQASRPTAARAPSKAAQPTSTPAPPQPMSSRIPLELQEIFLRSNAGENVEEILPPSNGNAFKVFKGRSGSVWPSILRRNPSRRPLLVPSKSKRRVARGSDNPKADQSVQSCTGNTVETSSPLSHSQKGPTPTASPIRAPKEIVYVPRIPEELQEIFVQSNRGDEVHYPPRSGAAFKVFAKRDSSGIDRHVDRPRHEPTRANRTNNNDLRVNSAA